MFGTVELFFASSSQGITFHYISTAALGVCFTKKAPAGGRLSKQWIPSNIHVAKRQNHLQLPQGSVRNSHPFLDCAWLAKWRSVELAVFGLGTKGINPPTPGTSAVQILAPRRLVVPCFGEDPSRLGLPDRLGLPEGLACKVCNVWCVFPGIMQIESVSGQ